MRKTPKTDQERIEALETRVKELETRARALEREDQRFRDFVETRICNQLEEMRAMLDPNTDPASLGIPIFSLDLQEDEEEENREPVRILGDLGLPPVEIRGRGKRGRKEA